MGSQKTLVILYLMSQFLFNMKIAPTSETETRKHHWSYPVLFWILLCAPFIGVFSLGFPFYYCCLTWILLFFY